MTPLFKWLLVFHVLGATVWVGGHLVLALSVLPQALRAGNPKPVQTFEGWFERIGIPALIVQVVTGIYLATTYFPGFHGLLALENPLSRYIVAKLVLLGGTVVLAVDARLRIIPHLSEENLGSLAWHIAFVTAGAVGFAVLGVGIRLGGY